MFPQRLHCFIVESDASFCLGWLLLNVWFLVIYLYLRARILITKNCLLECIKWQHSPGSEIDSDYMGLATLSGCFVYTAYLLPGVHFLVWGLLIRGDTISSKSLLGLSHIIFGFPNLWLSPVHSRISAVKAGHWWNCSTTMANWTEPIFSSLKPLILGLFIGSFCSGGYFPSLWSCRLLCTGICFISIILFALCLPEFCISDGTLACFLKFLWTYYCFTFLMSFQWNFGRVERKKAVKMSIILLEPVYKKFLWQSTWIFWVIKQM